MLSVRFRGRLGDALGRASVALGVALARGAWAAAAIGAVVVDLAVVALRRCGVGSRPAPSAGRREGWVAPWSAARARSGAELRDGRGSGRPGTLAALAIAGLLLGCRTASEIPRSQRARLEQHIGRLVVSIEYNRPVARGRRLFGGIVPLGEPWNPGADRATTIRFSGEVTVEGHSIPPGRYSVWVVPRVERWTLILSRAADVFHVPYPEGQDQLRVTLGTGSAPHMETLAFYFPVVDGDSAVLHLHWGETVLPIRLRAPEHPR
jgi:hypothetical protein